MTKFAMAIDKKRCVACNRCSMACKVEHNLPLGLLWNQALYNGTDRLLVPQGTQEEGLKTEMYTLACQHCDEPACVEACPTGASAKREDGIVTVDYETCIGCESCLAGCPYDVRTLNPNTNVVEKCTLCFQRRGDEKWVPACVHNCCCGARLFGDLDDPESDVSKAVAAAGEENCHHVADPGGLAPATVYILHASTAAWQDDPSEVVRYGRRRS